MIQKILNGDKEAFRPLVLKYQKLVYAAALKVTGEKTAAEDVSQEAFWQAYRSLENYRFESAFSTWITRITINKALDYCRQEKNRPYLTENAKLEVQADLQVRSPEDILLEREQKKELKEKIDTLPVIYRQAIRQHCLERRSLKEIAAAEQVSVKTIESRLYRARSKMKKKKTGGDIHEMSGTSRF